MQSAKNETSPMTPQALKSARHALGMSINQFSHLTRVDPRSVRRWEDGSRAVPGSVETILAILDELKEYPTIRAWLLDRITS
jgi:DNA-binding transcriptional regulator YiaG